ncbi:MAG TPA: hypothetical protein DCP63_11400 [Bacteroidetes bacterium]|nr:hypothetical protein [Bacteroidota bacterium]
MSQEGFTLQETVVALTVGSLLVGLVLTASLFTRRVYGMWRIKTEVREVVGTLFQRMMLDAQQSTDVLTLTDSTLVLKKSLGALVSYRFDGKNLWRDDVRIGGNEDVELSVRVASQVPTAAGSGRLSMIHISVEGALGSSGAQVDGWVSIPSSSQQTFVSAPKIQ